MIKTISGQLKEKARLIDPERYGRSDTSALGRWFWEIDKVLLLLITLLIAIGLIAVAVGLVALLSLMKATPLRSRMRSMRWGRPG